MVLRRVLIGAGGVHIRSLHSSRLPAVTTGGQVGLPVACLVTESQLISSWETHEFGYPLTARAEVSILIDEVSRTRARRGRRGRVTATLVFVLILSFPLAAFAGFVYSSWWPPTALKNLVVGSSAIQSCALGSQFANPKLLMQE